MKALRRWLKLKPSELIPKGWLEKRQKICERLDKLDNEVDKDTIEETVTKEEEEEHSELKKTRKKLNLADQIQRSYGAIDFNILRRGQNEEMQEWKSYPGMEKIVRLSRNIVENNDTRRLMELIKIMRVHESQQTAPIVATIALLVGNTVKDIVSKEVGLLIGDIIRWDVTIIKQRTEWPKRKKFSSTMIYKTIKEEEKMKRIVHGYLGRKASKEQFPTSPEPNKSEDDAGEDIEKINTHIERALEAPHPMASRNSPYSPQLPPDSNEATTLNSQHRDKVYDQEEDKTGDKTDTGEEVKAEDEDADIEKNGDADAKEETVEAEEVRDAEAIHDDTYICSLTLVLCGISTYNTYDIMRRVWAKTIAHARRMISYVLYVDMPQRTSMSE